MIKLFPLILIIIAVSLPAEIEISLISSDLNHINLKVDIGNIHTSNVIQNGQNYTSLTISNTHSSGQVGEPLIPVIRKLVEIPHGAEVEIQAAAIEENQIFITNRLFPVQPSVWKIPDSYEEFTIDNLAYQSGKIYGEQIVKITDSGFIRGHRFITLEIYPVLYNPGNGNLIFRNLIDVNLTLTGSDLISTQKAYNRYYTRLTEIYLDNTMLNAFAYEILESYPPMPIGYLIITPDAYVSTLDSFAAWKHMKGYHVTIASLSQTGFTSGDIKNYIQNAYDQWNIPPQFILFVGDNEIPAFTGTQTSSITDHPYAQLDGSDMFPDVWTGRWSISSISELEHIIEKTMIYEHPALWNSGEAWSKKAVFMASNHNYTITEGTHRWVIQTFLGPYGYFCDTLWNHSGATTAQVSSAYNDGRSLGVFSGHGSTISWSDGPQFNQSNVNALTNTYMYPVVQSYACYTGKWSVSECFAETWIRAEDKGAVSFWGSSPGSCWTEDDTLERWVFQAIFDSLITWERGFYDYGLFGVYTYGGTYVQPKYYYEAYNLFGDPSLDAWTDYPVSITITHPNELPKGISVVHINVNSSKAPIEDALIAFSDDDSLWTDYSNASGSADIQINTTGIDTITLVVTGHNLDPYQVDIPVTLNGIVEQPVVEPNVQSFSFNIPCQLSGEKTITLFYSLGFEAPVALSVYDLSGREVIRLVDQIQRQGEYHIQWDKTDSQGISLSQGTYFFRITAGEFVKSCKLNIVR